MAAEVWVDTGGFYAMLDHREKWHEEVKRQISDLKSRGDRIITSDYVLDETVALLQARGLSYLIVPWMDGILESNSIEIVWMDAERFREVYAYYRSHSDKQWSFTDCFSFSVMKKRKIQRALAADQHFRQAGFEPLLVD
jgi:uncharacterized protein